MINGGVGMSSRNHPHVSTSVWSLEIMISPSRVQISADTNDEVVPAVAREKRTEELFDTRCFGVTLGEKRNNN